MFNNKIKKGSLKNIEPTLVGTKDGIKILRVTNKKINTLAGVETDIAIATLRINNDYEDVIIISDKFYKKPDKNYHQDMITLMAKRIKAAGTSSYACDDEVIARMEAIEERGKTGFFGKRSFEHSVKKYTEKENKSITRATRYALKNGIGQTSSDKNIILTSDEYIDDDAENTEAISNPS